MTGAKARPASLRPAKRAALRVGLPRAMGMLEYGGLWQRFFGALGCETVLSPPTDGALLDAGVRAAVCEFCLPLKALLGHIRALDGKADVIFVPRVLSAAPGEMSCPKACALPDIARLACVRTPIVELAADPDKYPRDESRALRLGALAHRLGVEEETVRAALIRAAAHGRPNQLPCTDGRGAVALLGHPYVLHDAFLSMHLAEKLARRGLAVYLPDDLPRARRRADVRPYNSRAFYTIGLDILGAAHAFAGMSQVRGVVYLSPFGCGIDAVASAHARAHLLAAGMPFLLLTVDEQTGEAGFDTRVEAFLDMLEERE